MATSMNPALVLLLLALPSTTGSTLYYWLYPLLLVLALPSTTGSILCYWLYPLLLALLSTIIGYTLSTQPCTSDYALLLT